MAKCVLCEKEALLCIKGMSEYYCKECAEEHFDEGTLVDV